MSTAARLEAIERELQQLLLTKEAVMRAVSKTALWRQYEIESARLEMLRVGLHTVDRDSESSTFTDVESLVEDMGETVERLISVLEGRNMQHARGLCANLQDSYSLAMARVAGVPPSSTASQQLSASDQTGSQSHDAETSDAGVSSAEESSGAEESSDPELSSGDESGLPTSRGKRGFRLW